MSGLRVDGGLNPACNLTAGEQGSRATRYTLRRTSWMWCAVWEIHVRETVKIRLRAGTKSSGEAVYELLPAWRMEDGSFELAESPMLVIGIAAGDRIRITDGDFEITSRSGNLAIQVFGVSPTQLSQLETELSAVGGRLDGFDARAGVFTVPLWAGFQAIEQTLNSAGVTWYYGNVYDTDGKTPIGWWE